MTTTPKKDKLNMHSKKNKKDKRSFFEQNLI